MSYPAPPRPFAPLPVARLNLLHQLGVARGGGRVEMTSSGLVDASHPGADHAETSRKRTDNPLQHRARRCTCDAGLSTLGRGSGRTRLPSRWTPFSPTWSVDSLLRNAVSPPPHIRCISSGLPPSRLNLHCYSWNVESLRGGTHLHLVFPEFSGWQQVTVTDKERDVSKTFRGFKQCFWSVDGGEAGSQAAVFDAVTARQIESVLAGKNASVITYGQTGTGQSLRILTLMSTLHPRP